MDGAILVSIVFLLLGAFFLGMAFERHFGSRSVSTIYLRDEDYNVIQTIKYTTHWNGRMGGGE